MSIGFHFDDEEDYDEQSIGYHFDDIDWEYFIHGKEIQCHKDRPTDVSFRENCMQSTKTRKELKNLVNPQTLARYNTILKMWIKREKNSKE